MDRLLADGIAMESEQWSVTTDIEA